MKVVTEEQMSFIAKAATDSYFANLDSDTKTFMMSDMESYMKDYIKAFDIALSEVKKHEAQKNKMEEFGMYEDANSRLFK